MSQIITITHQPPDFSPVYTDGLFFTIIADINFPKFRYVYEVYVNNELIFTGKCTPNPFGLGIVDVSGVLKNYVSNLPLSYFEDTPIYTHETFPYSRPLEDHVIQYNVKFGYEYADDEISTVQQYNGFGTFDIDAETGIVNFVSTLGPPAVDSGVFKTYQATMGVNGRATQQEFDMNPFILSGTPINTNPTTSGLFLTNSPRTRNIQPSEYYTLGFTNYYLNESELLSQPYYAEYKFYDINGQLIDTKQYLNIFSNGGGPLTDCNSVYQSYYTIIPKSDTEYNTLYLGVGPKNIIDFPANTAQYTVQLFGNFTGTTSPPPPPPTATPTITPTPVPCTNCTQYSITNNSFVTTASYEYRDCNTLQSQRNVLAPQTVFTFCACGGTFIEETNVLDVEIDGPCGPKPCDTCQNITIYNNNSDVSVILKFWDCSFGGYREISLQPFSGAEVCGCANSFGDLPSGVSIIPQESCEPVTPTPTPTPSCLFLSYQVSVCNGSTCINGTCQCTFGAVTTVYTDCSTFSPFKPNARIYADSALTQPFIGTISNGITIFDVVSVSGQNYGLAVLNCIINGPC